MTYLSDSWTPACLAKTELWLDAADRESLFTVGNVRASLGDRVTRWREKIRAVNFDEVAASGPTLLGNGIENRPYLRFAGAQYLRYAVSAWLGSATAGDIWVLCRPDYDQAAAIMSPFATADEASSTRYTMVTHRGTLPYFEYYAYENVTQVRLISAAAGQTRAYQGQWNLLHVRSDAAAVAQEIAHNAITMTASSGLNSGQWFSYAPNRDNVTVGARVGSAVANQFTGGIAEIVVTSSALSTGERARMREYFSRKYPPLGQVAAMGDSWMEADIALYLGYALRERPWGGISIVDHGVGSELIADIGIRWDANVEGKGYRYAVLQGGINDIKATSGGGSAAIYTEYARIASEMLTDGLRVVLCTVSPFFGHANWSAVRQTELELLNTSIRALAASDPRYRLCDIYELIREPGGTAIKGDWSLGDGLHCNPTGDVVIANVILQKLKELVY